MSNVRCKNENESREVGLLELSVEKSLSLLTLYVAFLGLARKRPVSHLNLLAPELFF